MSKFQIRNSNIVLRIFSILSAFLIFSCGNKPQVSNSKFQIKDDAGVEVSFDSNPTRLISLAPNITEVLYAIGADSQLVGVTDLCDFPPAAKTKTKTGSYISPDYEVMTALNSDLIIMNVENTSNPTYQALKNSGKKVFVSNAKDLIGIEKMIKDFGKITGKEFSADTLLKSFEKNISLISKKDSATGDTIFVLISVNPLMTTNGKTFINDILNLAGITNLYKNESIDYPNINFEDVISRDPKYILFPTDTTDVQKAQKFTDEIRRQLDKTDAVKKDKIILIDENIMFRPTPRVLEAVTILRNKFDALKDQ